MGQKVTTIYSLFLLIFCTLAYDNENLAFDPRDQFLVSYYCEVFYRNTLDPDHPMYARDFTYHTTLDISKCDSSTILQISGEINTKIQWDPTSYSFIGADFAGQRLSGRFFSDSIYVYSYLTPAAIISWTYYGKKIVR